MTLLYWFTITYFASLLIFQTIRISFVVTAIVLLLYILCLGFTTFLLKKKIDIKVIVIGGIIWAAFISALNQKNTNGANLQEGNILFDGYVIDTPYFNRDSTIYQIEVQRYIQNDQLIAHTFKMKYIVSIPFADPIKNDIIRGRCKIFFEDEKIPICLSDINNPPIVIERRGFGFSNSIIGYKEEISKVIYNHYKGEASQILIALTTGNSKDMLYELRRIFAQSGTSHILAISGTHIGLIAIFLYYISKFLLFPLTLVRPFSLKKVSSLILIPCMILISFYFGNSPSVVRATIMTIVFLFSIIIERERDLLSSLFLSFLLITSYEPEALKDIGFQLSFLSVLGIVLFLPATNSNEDPKQESITKILIRYIKLLLLTSLAASLFTFPAVAYHFGIFSLIGIIANLVIVPFVGFIILPMIMLAVISFGISQSLAHLFFNGAFSAIKHFIFLNNLFASIPLSHIKIFVPSLVEISLYFMILFLFIFIKKVPFSKIIIISLLFVLILTSLIFDRIEKNRIEPSIVIRRGLIIFIDENIRPHIIIDRIASGSEKREAVNFLRERRMIRTYYSNFIKSDDMYIEDHLYTNKAEDVIQKSESGDFLINLFGFSIYVFNSIENCPPRAARFVISRRNSVEAIEKLYECEISPERLIFSGDKNNNRLIDTLNRIYGDSASKILLCKDENCKILLSPQYN